MKALILPLIALLIPALSFADKKASEVSISTPRYNVSSESFKPALGRYTYWVGWQGIPAGTATFSLEKEGLLYRATAEANSLDGIKWVYSLRYRAEGILSAFDFTPRKFAVDQKENSRQKITEVTYQLDGDVKSFRWNNRDKEDSTEMFDPNNFMLDPISSAMVARGADWKVGDQKEFDVFNGKSRYLIALSAERRETLKVNGENRPVLVISPTVKKLTDPNADSKLRKASIYVSDDPAKEVLQIKSEVFVGAITIRLDKFEPSADLNDQTTFLARAKNGEIILQ